MMSNDDVRVLPLRGPALTVSIPESRNTSNSRDCSSLHRSWCIPERPFFTGAIRDLRRGAPGMDVPVALALGLAYGASVINTLRGAGEIYIDSVTMFIFFLLAGDSSR